MLTGITEAMVAPAPTIEEVLPALLEFLAGAVFVAHNAPVRHRLPQGGLRAARLPLAEAAGARHRRAGPPGAHPRRGAQPQARHAGRATSAPPPSPPTARCDDARATVEVLHALIGRLGSHKVYTLEETIEFAKAISPAQRRKRHLAEGLPDAPGVYIFRDAEGRPLYVGTSGSIATRVRSYFTAAEKRASGSRR